MKAMFVPALIAPLLASCNDTRAPDRQDAAAPPSPLAIDYMQESPRPGATNTGVTPTVVLRGGHPVFGEDAAAVLAADLGQRMLFVSADGQAVAAAAVSVGRGDNYDYVLNAQPAAPLLADTWYDVTYAATPLVVGERSEFLPRIKSTFIHDLGDGVLTRFFTGSAPQLCDLILLRQSHDGATGLFGSLLVVLSENVPLADWLAGGFAISAGSAPVPGTCLIGGRPCDAAVPIPGAAIDKTFSFIYQLDGELPAHFDVALSLLLLGETRTVQEAWDAGMVRGTTVASDGFLRYSMDTAAWRDRMSVSGLMLGWSNVE